MGGAPTTCFSRERRSRASVTMLLDFVVYLAIALILTFAGAGLVALLGLRVPAEVRFLLGPCVLQAVWACALGLGVTAGWPVRTFALPLWAATAALTLVGLFSLWPRATSWRRPAPSAVATAASIRREDLWLPALCLLLPLLSMAPYLAPGLIAGYRGSGNPDGWSYVAYGQYLWEHAQGSVGSLSLLHRYGADFSHTRHAASAELGLLSRVTSPGDTQTAAGLLQALSIASFVSACAAFARLRGHGRPAATVFAALVAVSGWTANVIWANNYDHGLALAYFPALAALALSLDALTISGGVTMGLLAAATMYTYPELSPVVLGCTGVLFVAECWRDRRLAARARVVVAAAVVLVLLMAPYWPDFWAYWRYQVTTRPGLMTMHGLVEPRFIASAFWALGGEHRAATALAAQNGIGLLLFGVLAIGAWRLIRRGDWPLALVLVLVLAVSGGLIVWSQYSYGAYKMILTGWWIVAYTLTLAIVAASGAHRWARAESWAAAGIVAMIPAAVLARDLTVLARTPPVPMARLQAVKEAARVIGEQPTAILVDEEHASYWAVYYLRGAHARLGDFAGYLAWHMRARVERADDIPWSTVRFVLTDDPDRRAVPWAQEWTMVWRGGVYALWDTHGRPWAVVTDVREGQNSAANGALGMSPTSTIRVGERPTSLTIVASQSGAAMLSAAIGQPSTAGVEARLVAECPGHVATLDVATAHHLIVPLVVQAGESICSLRVSRAPAAGSGKARAEASPTITLTGVHARWTDPATPAGVAGARR